MNLEKRKWQLAVLSSASILQRPGRLKRTLGITNDFHSCSRRHTITGKLLPLTAYCRRSSGTLTFHLEGGDNN